MASQGADAMRARGLQAQRAAVPFRQLSHPLGTASSSSRHIAETASSSSKASQPPCSSNTASLGTIQRQARPSRDSGNRESMNSGAEFERALSDAHPADTLRLWHRYVRWTRKHNPDAEREVLRKAAHTLVHLTQLHKDIDYVRLLLMHAKFKSDKDKTKFYRDMDSRGIGNTHAILYEVWACELERKHRYEEAAAIYKRGFQQRAQPSERLRGSFVNFCNRMRQRNSRSSGSSMQNVEKVVATASTARTDTQQTLRRVSKSHMKFARRSLGAAPLMHPLANRDRAPLRRATTPRRAALLPNDATAGAGDVPRQAQSIGSVGKASGARARSGDTENIAPLNLLPSQPSKLTNPRACSSTHGKRKIAETGSSSMSEPTQTTKSSVDDAAPPLKRSRLAGLGAWWPFRKAIAATNNDGSENTGNQLADVASCVTAATNASSSSSSSGGLVVSKAVEPMSAIAQVGLLDAQIPLSPSAAARRKLWDMGAGHAFLDKREKAQYANVQQHVEDKDASNAAGDETCPQGNRTTSRLARWLPFTR